MTKSKINLLLWKTRVEASNVEARVEANPFFNNIRFCRKNPFNTFPWPQYCHYWPVIDKTR